MSTSHLKFDGPRLDELLERVGRELGPDAVIVEANRTRRGGVGGFFAREWFEVVVADPAAATETELESGSESEDPLLALARNVEDPVESSAPRAVEEPASFAQVLARAGAPAPPSEAPAVPRAEPNPAPAPSPAPAPDPAPAPAPAPGTTRLRDLGLSDMLDELDRMVPTDPVVAASRPIVAVVGDLSVARTAAASLATRLGLAEGDVAVASRERRDGIPAWLHLDSPEAAEARVARWRRGEQPVVVVVDLTPGRDGHLWAADVLRALDADQTRLVARAWQVTDELAPKAAVLGGVDGLELVELDAAAEPEAFLDLDLPVVGLDGRPATSELWAALLLERRNDAIA